MSLIEDIRVMDAIYWEATGRDTRSNFVYANPIDVKVRWQDGETTEEGMTQDVTYNGTIFVDRDMPKGSRLMKGTIADNLKAPLPPPDAAKVIRKTFSIPDFDNEEVLYKVTF